MPLVVILKNRHSGMQDFWITWFIHHFTHLTPKRNTFNWSGRWCSLAGINDGIIIVGAPLPFKWFVRYRSQDRIDTSQSDACYLGARSIAELSRNK